MKVIADTISSAQANADSWHQALALCQNNQNTNLQDCKRGTEQIQLPSAVKIEGIPEFPDPLRVQNIPQIDPLPVSTGLLVPGKSVTISVRYATSYNAADNCVFEVAARKISNPLQLNIQPQDCHLPNITTTQVMVPVPLNESPIYVSSIDGYVAARARKGGVLHLGHYERTWISIQSAPFSSRP